LHSILYADMLLLDVLLLLLLLLLMLPSDLVESFLEKLGSGGENSSCNRFLRWVLDLFFN
jgi:hypothetical protein